MPRLLIHVEGETEETFVNEVLASHLHANGYQSVSARLIGNARQRSRRGGIREWHHVRDDIVRHLRGDAHSLSTLMVDYYGLPDSWPGRTESKAAALGARPRIVAERILQDVCRSMGCELAQSRFIPFIVMHEFEGLLFSDCAAFAAAIDQMQMGPQLQAIRAQYHSPEEINDSPLTAPSKRIRALIPNYEKPLFGTLAALQIGLPRIRAECPHFASWIEELECRGASAAGGI